MTAISRVPGRLASDTPEFPRYNVVIYLDDGNAQAWTVPDDVKFVIISPTAACWANLTTTATVPAADSTDGTASFRIPANAALQVRVPAGGSLSFIREAASTMSISIGCWDNN